MLLFAFRAGLNGAVRLQTWAACDIFYSSCLQTVHGPPIIQALMIISTLRVGPLGPLFLFWESSELPEAERHLYS
jgi:hypothetical protein